jgi:hypothetical protein
MDINFTYNFILEEGNYNIEEFEKLINTTCIQYLEIKYDHHKNKWLYTSKEVINNEVSIMPTTFNSKYFGFPADVWTLLPNVGGILSNQINLNNFGLIVIKVLGLIQQNRTLDNLNKTISSGDICALISRQDTAVNALVNWIDYNKTFMKKIANTEINYLSFIFTDEYNNLLYELNDWLITMTITVRKKQYQQ